VNLIETLEQEEIARLGKNIPDFAPGDTVRRQALTCRRRAQARSGFRGSCDRQAPIAA